MKEYHPSRGSRGVPRKVTLQRTLEKGQLTLPSRRLGSAEEVLLVP